VADIDIDNAAMEALLYRARRNALEDASARLVERGMVNCPVGKTGNLRRSHKKIDPNADATEAGAEATADYAAAVHDGARPHTIPNAFGRGKPVEHPGNEPNPWLRRSVDELASENR
jgi:hypothetical protein